MIRNHGGTLTLFVTTRTIRASFSAIYQMQTWIRPFALSTDFYFLFLRSSARRISSTRRWLGCNPGVFPNFPIGEELANQMLRQFVRISVGGNRLRIRLSDEGSVSYTAEGEAKRKAVKDSDQ